MDWISGGSALLGALLGGAATLLGVKWQLHSATKAEEARQYRHELSVLKAIRTEIQELWDIYSAGVGSAISKHQAGVAFRYYWPAYSDYFTVFNGNAVFIGQLDDDELRKSIVRAYVRAKSTVDSFTLNNSMESHSTHLSQIAQRDPSAANHMAATAAVMMQADYAKVLKDGHTELQEAFQVAITLLDLTITARTSVGQCEPV